MIGIKPSIVQGIIDKYDGIPGEPQYDYMCAHTVGSTFTSHSPYFEFDDRSPEKYLFVGSYGQDGPPIDLNSIQF